MFLGIGLQEDRMWLTQSIRGIASSRRFSPTLDLDVSLADLSVQRNRTVKMSLGLAA